MIKKMLGSKKVRFVLVGLANTGVDFGVLFALVYGLGTPAVLANVVSTSTALVVSYTLNKKAVFRSTSSRKVRQFVMFLVVTGLWVLQNIVIHFVTSVPGVGESGAGLLLAKLLATACSMVWNYIWYSRVIFKEQHAR
jgi:putative flippase GtrA